MEDTETIIRIQLASWRLTFTIAPVSAVIGVNSTLPDGNHILMWDFDDIPYPKVRNELQRVQGVYELPRIYILSSGKPRHHIAYCFKKVGWRTAVEIITFTHHVDWGFIKFGVYRGHFTLRVTPKSGRKPYLKRILPSEVQEDVFILELKSWVSYQTIPDNYKLELKELVVK